MSQVTHDGRVVNTRPNEEPQPGQCHALTLSGWRCTRPQHWQQLCIQHDRISKKRTVPR